MADSVPPLPPQYVALGYASPVPLAYNADLEHLRLLSVFHFVVGPLTILLSSTTLGIFTLIVLFRPTVVALYRTTAGAQ